MKPYAEGRLDRYSIGIPRELSEIRTQPWLIGEGSLTCDPCDRVRQARQTRPNSGGVAESQPRFDKGGVAIIFYFFRVKNRTF